MNTLTVSTICTYKLQAIANIRQGSLFISYKLEVNLVNLYLVQYNVLPSLFFVYSVIVETKR